MTQLTQSAPLASWIDHTLLKADATRAEIEKLCFEAKQFGFATVCVSPFRVAQASELLGDSEVKVCTVVGFPLGIQRAEIKAMETVRALADGATEIDMVINIGAVKDGNWGAVEADISAVIKAARGRTVKVILETALLTRDEKVRAAKLAKDLGAQFVKTSTGMANGGATVEDVQLLREVVGPDFGVKASGGIRDKSTMLKMIEAGANRIGTSAGVQIMNDQSGKGDY